MLAMDTGAAEFNDFIAHRLEWSEIKFLRGVVTEVFGGIATGLQTVSADNLLRGQMLDNQMIANGVERIGVQTGDVGLRQSFVEFEVENLKAQLLRGLDFHRAAGNAGGVLASGTNEQPDGFKGLIHTKIMAKPCGGIMSLKLHLGDGRKGIFQRICPAYPLLN